MRLYLRMAWRNIGRHRRRTVIVVLSIGMTMMLMMLYDGMVAGFERAIYANAVRVLGGNIQIHANGYSAQADQLPLLPLENDQAVVAAAAAQPNVLAASRRVNTSGVATTREGVFHIAVVGIEPEVELPVSLVAQNVSKGRYLASADLETVFIGKGLADAMGVAVGDRLTLAGRAVQEQTRRRTVTVVGIFDLRVPDLEKRTVYMSLAGAQDLTNLRGQSTEVAIALRQLGQERDVMAALRPKLPGYEIASWETNFPELQAALQSKGGAMNIFGIIILFISGIGILNLLLMAVFERTREIGVLGALGMKPRGISLLFMLEGVMLGVLGVAFGVCLGLALNAALGQVGLDYSRFASLTEYTALITGKVFPSLGMEQLGGRALTALVIAALASLYPAREAARSDPARALHFV